MFEGSVVFIKQQKIRKMIAQSGAVLLALALVFPVVTGDIRAAGKKLIPLGCTTGIKMFSGGAMVIGFASEKMLGCVSPAEQNGLQIGDVITAVDGQRIECNEQLGELISALPEGKAELTVRRDGEEQMVIVSGLAKTSTGYKLGAWVRDSMAGIGTITYVDPETGNFGALGHGICDVDTGTLMPFDNGSIMGSAVVSVTKGKAGAPGQLCGAFDLKEDSGVLYKNTQQGVFGCITDQALYADEKAYEIAGASEVEEGNVEIISNVNGTEVEHFDGRIIKLLEDDGSSKNFMLEITDPDLIDRTGGIVQGMSGSPIIQDGKLIGAVTRVLVNDPTRCYGMFIENMLEAAE